MEPCDSTGSFASTSTQLKWVTVRNYPSLTGLPRRGESKSEG